MINGFTLNHSLAPMLKQKKIRALEVKEMESIQNKTQGFVMMEVHQRSL
jgi:hypothetical protein